MTPPYLRPARFVFALLLLTAVWSGYELSRIESERRALREDAIEISKIKYGIFNVDEWKRIATGIIAVKIDELDLSDTDRQVMQERISAFLYQLVAELQERFEEENRKGLVGFLKREGAGFFGIFSKMERDVPIFTQQILRFIDNPQNRENLKTYLGDKLESYADATFSETDYEDHDRIIEKYGKDSKKETLRHINSQASELQLSRKPYSMLLYGLILSCILFLILARRADAWVLSFQIGISLVALFLGVSLPMIEIDARIDRLQFSLMGELVHFSDQVLYFKSKSILEVVQLMWEQGKADLLLVALLVLAFSVLFPLAKTLASLFYIHSNAPKPPPSRGRHHSGWIHLLVFKTGKWSMADVMVVAIFMSYIGFSGIVSEQLGQLEGIARNADVLTTNHSSLQIGFFMFAAYVILSLSIAQALDGRRFAGKLPTVQG